MYKYLSYCITDGEAQIQKALSEHSGS